MRVTRRRRRNYTRLYILLAAVLVFIGGVAAYCFMGDSDTENMAAQSGIERPESYMHIMVMGVDRRADDVGRSDTLMVLTINKDAGTAEILSLPRDTRVAIENNGYDKINHAYAYGGSQLTRKTVESLLGVPMDYYVLIDVKAFERIIDALDGIDIDVEKRMYYEDPWDDNGGLVIDLYPGMQHLTGDTAIQYVRYRDGEGDIGRIQRQQHFMRAVLDKMLTPEILPKLPQLAEEVYSAVETDMPLSEMASLTTIVQSVREHGVESAMLPGKPAYLKDISYWLPDINGVRELVAKQMNTELTGNAKTKADTLAQEYEDSLPQGLTMLGDSQEAAGNTTEENTGKDSSTDTATENTAEKNTASDTSDSSENGEKESAGSKTAKQAKSRSDISVLIINDSGMDGAAARMAENLQAEGYNVTGVDTGRRDDRAHTIIVTDSSNVSWFYGMDFPCTIMDGGDAGEAVIYIGQDYE